MRDAVVLNAGAALAVYDAPEVDVPDALAAGVAKATEAIDSGSARGGPRALGGRNVPLADESICHTCAVAYGGLASSVLSVIAFVCTVGVVLGYGPMVAIVGMLCAVGAMARGEDLAGPAVLVALVVLVLAFLLPTEIALNRL